MIMTLLRVMTATILSMATYDSDGIGSSQQIKVADLNTNLALTNNDFELV